MLYLIKGRAGSGKSAYLRQKLLETLNNSKSRPLLIIPEQFSFDTEKTMLNFLGAKKLKQFDILSFSRLAFSSLKNTPYFTKNIPDGGVRNVLMSQTLKELEGRLNIFTYSKSNNDTLGALVDFSKELKYCSIDDDFLKEKIELLNGGFLKEKLQELSLINEGYNALVSQSYFDDTDCIRILTDYATEVDLFKNRTIFIDGFRTFTKQEFDCLEVMLYQSDDVYITLCTDQNPKRYSSFDFIKKFENKLRSTAAKNNIIVDEHICLQNENVFPNHIFQLDKALFSQNTEVIETDGSIEIYECTDSDEECTFVANTIKKLLRSGKYRCRDIAVIERTGGVYKNRLVSALKRLDVPVFDDSKRSLSFETLFVYLNGVLSCVSDGFTTENIFNYLKTGFTKLSVSEVCALEKYALIWGINGKGWLNDFTMHPDGFGKDFDEKAVNKLNEINAIRKKAILPLVILKKEVEDKDGKEIAGIVFDFLIEQNIPDKLYSLYSSLNDNGFPVEAERHSVSWVVLTELLDTMATLGEGKYFGIKRWFEMFCLLVDSKEIGEIPQGLDEVRIGSADRIRIEQVKVVFLIGVNKDEFPLVSVKNGILTDADRVNLTAIGLEVKPPFEDSVDEERFIAYCAVTAASEKLYLSYKTINDDGSKGLKSEIIETALNIVSDPQVHSYSLVEDIEKVEGIDGAFSLLSKNFNNNSTLTSTLFEYFKDKDEFKGRLSALKNISNSDRFNFEDSTVSEKLFGKDMYLSASRVESFYNCPFSYFMRYGLKAEPLRVAELDPAQSGTIVHLVMETVLKEFPKATFLTADEETLKATVSRVLTEYLDEKMGGVDEKSKRFMFLFNRLLDISMAIIERLKGEFDVGSYEPADFELKIGGDEIPHYTLSLENGQVMVTGSIDRVDLMEKDGIKYIRVVDYKTGKKEFKLSELFDGLNIQMVLYLMALEKNGTDYYGGIVPSGVLYLPSRIGIGNFLDVRSPSAENIAAQKRVSGKLSGMILDSPVVFNGMGVDKIPDYFPVGYKKDGTAKGDYYTLENFRNLSRLIDKKIINMGNSLHNGRVSPVPVGKDGEGKMCKYCAYKPICGYEYGDETVEITSLTHGKALERLEGNKNE